MDNLYKYSQFNIEVDTKENGDKYIFNTYTCKGLWIDKEDQKLIIDKSDIDPLDISQEIVENGIVIDNTLDELQRVKDNVVYELKKLDILFVNIVLTRACNYKCKYCFEEHAIRNEYMNINIADNIIKYIKDNDKGTVIKFFGGEPLLNINVIRYILDELQNLNIKKRIEMYTNGRLLTPDIVDELYNKGVNGNIIITIDGLKDYYTYIKGCNEDDYDSVINNIKYAQTRLNIIIQLNISNENKSIIEDTVNYLHSNGINTRIITNQVRPCNAIDINNTNYICYSDYESTRKRILGRREIKRNKTGCEGRLPNYLVVDTDGSVLPCEHLLGNKDYIIGNIRDVSSKDIIEYKTNTIWDNIKIIDDCKDCEILPICLGECSEIRYIGNIECEYEQRLDELINNIRETL